MALSVSRATGLSVALTVALSVSRATGLSVALTVSGATVSGATIAAVLFHAISTSTTSWWANTHSPHHPA
jgi:hypothetical protein